MVDASGNGLRVQPLEKRHDRGGFCCGIAELDTYLRERALQDAERHVATPFVLVQEGPGILGYYTLSQQVLGLQDLPPDLARRLPRYPLLPATLIGRFAIDQRHQGKGLGGLLLIDALYRCWEAAQSVASYAVRVDATDERAAGFYQEYGFLAFPVDRLRLFLPMVDLDRLFRPARTS